MTSHIADWRAFYTSCAALWRRAFVPLNVTY
jgi:hypothetical protein